MPGSSALLLMPRTGGSSSVDGVASEELILPCSGSEEAALLLSSTFLSFCIYSAEVKWKSVLD